MGVFHSKIAPKGGGKIQAASDYPDPRSPTVNINRSPIGMENLVEKPIITKVRDLTSDLTEILDYTQTPERIQPTITGDKLQSVFDPRSPSSFVRTPMVLDETDASNISLRGTSLEYEEISGTEDQPSELEERSLSFQDCEEEVNDQAEGITVRSSGTDSMFSEASFNSELKSEIDSIIQNLYKGPSAVTAGNKDPRSPSINIQRTPIVFDEQSKGQDDEGDFQKPTEQTPRKNIVEISQNKQKDADSNTLKTSTPLSTTVIHLDENLLSLTNTPKREKSVLGDYQRKSLSRTPLGCVTNMNTPGSITVNGQKDMRKTALLTQMKQNASTVTVGGGGGFNSAEIVNFTGTGKKSTSGSVRSKIPVKSK